MLGWEAIPRALLGVDVQGDGLVASGDFCSAGGGVNLVWTGACRTCADCGASEGCV